MSGIIKEYNFEVCGTPEKVKEFINDTYSKKKLISVVFDGKNYVVFYYHKYYEY